MIMRKASKEKMIQFIHKNKKIFIIIFFIPFLIETAMILDTIPVMNEIKDNVAGKAPYIEGDPLEPINYYKIIEEHNNQELTNNYNLYRKFTLHNFKSGYIIIYLDRDIRDLNGKPVYGGMDVLKITIEKENGKWKATDIHGSLTPKFGE